jgi:hypothetical protein
MTEYGHSVANALFVFLSNRECRFVTRNKSGDLMFHQTCHFSEGKEIADYLDNDDLSKEVFAQRSWICTDLDFLLVPNVQYSDEELFSLFSNAHNPREKQILYEPSEERFGVIYSVYEDVFTYMGPDAQNSIQSAVPPLISFSKQQLSKSNHPFQMDLLVNDKNAFYIGWSKDQLVLCKKEEGPIDEMAYHAANAMEHLDWKGEQSVCRIWGEPSGRLKEYLTPYWASVDNLEVDIHSDLTSLEGAILCGL